MPLLWTSYFGSGAAPAPPPEPPGPDGPIIFGAFTGNNALGAQDISLGYPASGVVVWNNWTAGAANSDGNAAIAVGFMKSATERASVGITTEDAVSATDSGVALRTDYAMAVARIVGVSEVESQVFDYAGPIADGFRIDADIANAEFYQYLAFPPGCEIDIRSHDIANGTTEVVVNDLAFTPKLLLAFAGPLSTTEGISAGGFMGFGMASAADERYSVAIAIPHNADNPRAFRDGITTALLHLISISAVTMAIDLTALAAGGYTLAVDTPPATTTRIVVMAIGGANFQAKVGSGNIAGAGSADYTGCGFDPTAVLIADAASTTPGTPAAIGILSFGGADGTSQGAVGMAMNDNLSTANCQLRTVTDGVMAAVTGAGAAVQTAALTSFITDGFRLNHTVGSVAAFGYCAMRYGE